VKLLLDTHTFLWHADGDPRMSPAATALLIDPANELFLSMATEWEIAIKVGLKQLVLSSPYLSFMTRAITGCRRPRSLRRRPSRPPSGSRSRRARGDDVR
jgi:PIN domain nuclease of toxin-antitoxin system